MLEKLFETCRTGSDRTRWQAFERFQREQGEVLRRNCLFLALREHFAARDPDRADWHAWPEPYRDPASPDVRRFAETNRDRLEFFAWLQWIADDQLGAAAATARERGMAVGLYRDLAVGADRAGAETWVNDAAVVSGAQVGAPPDIFNPAGQDWGLPPFHPRALREEAYRSFVELVRANMRHAGGLRIDHVMGLAAPLLGAAGTETVGRRLCRNIRSTIWSGFSPSKASGTAASSSARISARCRKASASAWRRRTSSPTACCSSSRTSRPASSMPPQSYPSLALAVVGSHDLPTLRGWWEGRDLDIKERLGLFPGAGEARRQRETRERDKRQLVTALRRRGPARRRTANRISGRWPAPRISIWRGPRARWRWRRSTI